MFPEERQKFILDRINEDGTVKSDDLSETLKVSKMTIYRDLDKLQDQGLVERKYGGAILSAGLLEEKTSDEKSVINIDNKKLIAREAVNLIKDEEVVFLDGGSTNYQLALEICEKDFNNLRIITNDLKIANYLSKDSRFEIIIIGGKVDSRGLLTTGFMAYEFLKNFIIDKAFMGTQALSDDFYISTTKEEKIAYKKHLIMNASKSILLLDCEKFQQKRMFVISPLKYLDIIITDKSYKELEDYCENENVELIEARGEYDEI